MTEYAPWLLAVGTGVLAMAAAITGRWRLVLAPFHISSKRMTVSRLGLAVSGTEEVERVNAILHAFAGGFNRMLSGSSQTTWRSYADSLPVLFQPFAHEGAAMGFTPRRMMRFDPSRFEDELVRSAAQFRYLYYVGLGFWSGMRRQSAAGLDRVTGRLDAMYRYLCYDGYGFKHAFFDDAKDVTALTRLDAFAGYGRHAAYQGVGRAFWFRFMDDPQTLSSRIERLGVHAADAAAGVGLAAVFTFPDRLAAIGARMAALPEAWHRHAHLGMCFGLKARSINHIDAFERMMSEVNRPMGDAVFASIRECDRVELQVRADGMPNGYRRWRETVTDWLEENVDYPMKGLKRCSAVNAPRALRPEGSAS